MKKIFRILLFISIYSATESHACSCGDIPKSFSENIRANQIIFSGTVLEHIVIPNDSNYLMLYYGLTKIKVNKWYQNEMQADTIFYANGQGSMCISSVECFKKGDQMIIKAIKESIYDPSLEFYPNPDKKLIKFIESYKNKPIVGYGICDVSILVVENQNIIGNITKNIQIKKWRKINFIKRISKKWADKLKTKLYNSKLKYQVWTYDKFTKLMNRKWNSL